MTNWTQLLCFITVTLRFATTVMIRSNGGVCEPMDSLSPSLRRLYTVQSILSRTALPTVTVVAFNYWAFVFDPSSGSMWTIINQVQTHGINCLLMWVDHVLSAETIFYRSAIWPILFAILNALWNILFEFTIKENEYGDPYIYEVTDWSAGWEEPFMFASVGLITATVMTSLAVCTKNLIWWKQKDRFESTKKTTESEMTPSAWSSTVNSDTVDIQAEMQAKMDMV